VTEDELITYHFKRSPPMSTYLVAWVVGELRHSELQCTLPLSAAGAAETAWPYTPPAAGRSRRKARHGGGGGGSGGGGRSVSVRAWGTNDRVRQFGHALQVACASLREMERLTQVSANESVCVCVCVRVRVWACLRIALCLCGCLSGSLLQLFACQWLHASAGISAAVCLPHTSGRCTTRPSNHTDTAHATRHTRTHTHTHTHTHTNTHTHISRRWPTRCPSWTWWPCQTLRQAPWRTGGC
jgi:hypothetical protein